MAGVCHSDIVAAEGNPSVSRCQCIVVRESGDVTRCAAVLFDDSEKFCYHHKKYFEGDGYLPSPKDWETDMVVGGINRNHGINPTDHIVKVMDVNGDEVRTFDYSSVKGVTIMK